jgi:hypothetical protein
MKVRLAWMSEKPASECETHSNPRCSPHGVSRVRQVRHEYLDRGRGFDDFLSENFRIGPSGFASSKS